MNTYIELKNNPSYFIVNKKQVNKNKTLKTSILYNKIESSVNSSLTYYKNSLNLSFKNIEFDIIKNAYLNDKLIIKNNIKKLSDTEVILYITVSKKEEKKQNIICKATFGYSLQKIA
ncbi:hypothetical protein BA195_07855 [Tenacibaculum soleae]|uniref:Uncharacterized protein n=1 Tax=Tenacibaculum soleae TaxID=447689 RepID=A0A1B9XZ39_9FLAO|nr:hypothetical protein [Tenacibaculum soleae]MDO6743702.1 hypothetical protein [Tenacibaculum soleae]OCK42814.1 hypothetical protein BA195_07855 [Tenacibaculum soleae]